MVLTLTGCGGSNGDDITTYTYSSELDIKNLDSSDADDGCSLKAIHAVIDGLTKTDKKGNVTFSMMVQGVAVSANVTIRMVKGTNKCTATVSPNFNSNRISFSGYLYPSDQSNVFKGRAI